MSDHIEVMKKAIEFRGPEYLPIEVMEVPGLYDQYGLADPERAKSIPGTEDFDAADAYYSYTYFDKGKDEQGRPLRETEWGFVEMLPEDKYDYFIVKYPLANWDNLKHYEFPDASVTDEFFARIKKVIKESYFGRFITAYIDPGPFLTLSYMTRWDNLLASLCTDLDKVKYVFDGIIGYHEELVKRWKDAGAHMVQYFDEFASQDRMLLSPKLFREHFKPFYKRIFRCIHELGMYTGCGLDGKTLEIVPDMKDAGLDVFDCRQPRLMGIDDLAKVCDGKLCVKSSIDMQKTLPSGTREQIFREAEELVNKLGGRNGGFIALVIRWSVLEYPEENVVASAEAFNRFRRSHRRGLSQR